MQGSNLRRERKSGDSIAVPRNQFDTVSISRTVAEDCGVCAAFVFDDISRWIKTNATRGKHIHDGRVWMYDTIEQIAVDVGLFSLRTVKTALKKLVEKGYLDKGNFNSKGYDRTAWYSLGKKALGEKILIVQNLHDAKCKSCTMDSAKIAPPIPIDNNNNNITNNSCCGREAATGIVSPKGEYPQSYWDRIRKTSWPTIDELMTFLELVKKEYGVYNTVMDQAIAKWRVIDRSKARKQGIKNWQLWFLGFVLNKMSADSYDLGVEYAKMARRGSRE